MFEKQIIEFLKKNPNFAKYKIIYEHHYKNPKAFKSATCSLEMFLTDHIEGLIDSTLTRDAKALESEGILLNYEIEDLKLLN